MNTYSNWFLCSARLSAREDRLFLVELPPSYLINRVFRQLSGISAPRAPLRDAPLIGNVALQSGRVLSPARNTNTLVETAKKNFFLFERNSIRNIRRNLNFNLCELVDEFFTVFVIRIRLFPIWIEIFEAESVYFLPSFAEISNRAIFPYNI